MVGAALFSRFFMLFLLWWPFNLRYFFGWKTQQHEFRLHQTDRRAKVHFGWKFLRIFSLWILRVTTKFIWMLCLQLNRDWTMYDKWFVSFSPGVEIPRKPRKNSAQQNSHFVDRLNKLPFGLNATVTIFMEFAWHQRQRKNIKNLCFSRIKQISFIWMLFLFIRSHRPKRLHCQCSNSGKNQTVPTLSLYDFIFISFHLLERTKSIKWKSALHVYKQTKKKGEKYLWIRRI